MANKIYSAIWLSLALFISSASFSFGAEIIKRGNLVGERVSWTKGSVALVKDGNAFSIKLGAGFKTKSGPALFVYLGNGKPQKRIGKLKATSGSQSYAVPSSIDPRQYANLYIYCVPFNAIFGSAKIK